MAFGDYFFSVDLLSLDWYQLYCLDLEMLSLSQPPAETFIHKGQI